MTLARNALFVAAFASLTYGLWLAYPPLAYILPGAAALYGLARTATRGTQ